MRNRRLEEKAIFNGHTHSRSNDACFASLFSRDRHDGFFTFLITCARFYHTILPPFFYIQYVNKRDIINSVKLYVFEERILLPQSWYDHRTRTYSFISWAFGLLLSWPFFLYHFCDSLISAEVLHSTHNFAITNP